MDIFMIDSHFDRQSQMILVNSAYNMEAAIIFLFETRMALQVVHEHETLA